MSKIVKKSLKKHALVYIDDILTVSTDFESHLKYLTEIFESLPEYNLKANAYKKMRFS